MGEDCREKTLLEELRDVDADNRIKIGIVDEYWITHQSYYEEMSKRIKFLLEELCRQ